MKSFLEYVAKDLLDRYGNNLSKVAVVFPNKRASIFMNEYLAAQCDKPVWSPSYITISDLFRYHSKYEVPDQIKLICDLHRCFVKSTGIDESLDHFYGWGQLMLSDFDDIDKNMADASKVFANIRDLHAYDDVSYLSEEQKQILKQFFSNFTDDKNSELKQRFLNIWSRFLDIYTCFNNDLKANGYAYEGALYREVVGDETLVFDYDKYIFVGFNMTQKVEQELFKRLQKQGKADFYWDFDRYYTSDKGRLNHEAGHYIRQNISNFGCGLDVENDAIYNNFSKKKNISFISASTEDIQARYANDWLKEDERYKQGRKTAIVMCNEGMMQTVLHSLPEDVGAVNITTGYPLQQTPVASLIKQLVALRCDGFSNNRHKFILSYVNNVLNHPYLSFISDSYRDLLNELNNSTKVYYPTIEQLSKDETLALVFSNPHSANSDEATFELSMLEWLLEIIKILAERTKHIDDPLLKESVFKSYTMVNRLVALMKTGDLNVNYITLQSLLNQLIQSTSIPFHGEPAEGIQIMGVLETRNLDFDNLLILSCNEGNMPKGVNDTSFIPYSIRKAFGLTTIDNKVAIYAYYFYRLIQRASNITVLYNNATTDGNKNEMSRFMIQLMVESGHDIGRKAICIGLEPHSASPLPIGKSDAVMRKLIGRFKKTDDKEQRPRLTPTAINLYQRCQLRFYYNYVCNIKEPDLNEEDKIDGRMFGNIFHTASELIYKRLQEKNGMISPKSIDALLKSKVEIPNAVDEAFNKELFNLKTKSKPEYNGLQLLNRAVIIIYLRRMLKTDMKLGEFKIIGLEKIVKEDIEINTGRERFTTTLGGFIDRLDMISSGKDNRIRVIDYKTGKYKLSKIANFDELFSQKAISKHSDYYIQAMLYSKIVRESDEINPHGLPVSPSLLFIQQAVEDKDDIVLRIGGQTILDIKDYKTEFMDKMERLISDIFNEEIPFCPTDNSAHCEFCPYASVCFT